MPPIAFHIMVKPAGPLCNLKCRYCFYLEKEKIFERGSKYRMSDVVLESYTRQYIEGQSVPEVIFAWQGGEPTLLGVEFFRKAIEYQKKYAAGKQIQNAFQTNGILLNDEWCAFLAENNFLVGLSIDGPARLHDACRVSKGGVGTYNRVIEALRCLKKHKVEFNTLTCVSRANAHKAREVYRFLRDIGSGFLQFIPIVERLPDDRARALGLDLSTPPRVDDPAARLPVTEWSVEPATYGKFLCEVFDEWLKHDVGRTFVQFFDVTLGNVAGVGPGLCTTSRTCGTAMAIEHNGDLFSCDHYVYPDYRLGNVLDTPLAELAGSEFQRKFGADKFSTLPAYCRKCEYYRLCGGDCPKHRFLHTPDGEPGLSYLCRAYKMFFSHTRPAFEQMAALLRAGRAPAEIMKK